MDISKIQEIIKLLKDTDISEIEIKDELGTLRLSRQGSGQTALDVQQSMYYQPPLQPMPVSAPPIQAPAAAIASPVPNNETGHTVRSPMVGTLYSSPSPDAQPFVTIGQTVKVGDTLCIIEAMKMFNEIESDRAGKIVAIYANNGDPIEFDQALFVIE